MGNKFNQAAQVNHMLLDELGDNALLLIRRVHQISETVAYVAFSHDSAIPTPQSSAT